MLIRGQTTEQRIAEIASKFQEGLGSYQQAQGRQNDFLQKESAARRAALAAEQAAKEKEESANSKAEKDYTDATGRVFIGSGLGSRIRKGQLPTPEEIASLPLSADYQNNTSKNDRDNRVADSTIRKNDALANKAKSTGGGFSLSKGEEAADKEYGKTVPNFLSKGIVNSAMSIKRLEEVADELEKDQGFGEASGTKLPLPDWARSSDAIRRRETAKNSAFSTIKELLPGSVSDSDREAVTRDYYNDQLGAKENAKIIREKVTQLKGIRELEIQKADYFQQYGTLKGFRPSQPGGDTVSSMQAAPVKATPQAISTVKKMTDEQLQQAAKELGLL